MLEVVSWIIIAFITHMLDCYVFSKFINEKFVLNLKKIIIIFLFCIFDCIININYSDFFSVIATNLVTFIIIKIIYSKSISKTLIGTLFTYMGYVLAEIIYALFFMIILGISDEFIFDNYLGILFSNLIVFIIYILIYKLKFVLNIVSKIMNWWDEKRILNIISVSIIAMTICGLLVYQISYEKFNFNNILIIFSIIIGIVIFIFGYFKEKSGNNKLTIEYDKLLDYVKTYEKEVVDKSKKQHEYKNQLVIIDDMIPKSNKKAKEYLKKVLNNFEGVTDNDWLTKLKNLPAGGLKGLIHFKIKKMIDNKINIYVDVDNKLSKKDIWNNVDKNLEDISRILGVYLDNAIEAAERSNDKQIIIEFKNNNDNIEFILSNTYNGYINFNDLDKEGYSTKGKGRGVGLSLVKDIIDKNKILNQSREINGKFYVQKLYIKK